MDYKICLCMIVKNESKIITRLFDSLIGIIDGYCICDTGSTDNTIQVITTYFENKNINGKIIIEPFKNFSYNRNVALNACEQIYNYILLLDADMILQIGSFNKNMLDLSDSFNILQGNDNYNYYNRRIIKNNKTWKYYGPTHEYIGGSDKSKTFNLSKDILFIYDIGDGGSKINKFIRDIELLTKGLEDEPDNTRYMFYLANSYYDSQQNNQAIEWYKKIVNLKEGWNQEKYISCIRIYESYKRLGLEDLGIHYLIMSTKFDKKRIEGIYRLIKYYCVLDLDNIAYNFYLLIQDYLENSYYNSYTQLCDEQICSNLFCIQVEYKYYLPYFMIIISERIKKYQIGIRMYEIIFSCCYLLCGEWFSNNLVFNLQFFIDKVDKTNKTFFLNCKKYLDLLRVKYIIKHTELLDKYSEYFIENNFNIEYSDFNIGYSNTIPNILHFCFGLKEQTEEFLYSYYLAIISAKNINNPEKIYFYYYFEPYGKWWDKIKSHLILEKINVPMKIGNKSIIHPAHKADIVRLLKLYERGGIYLDIDTISVKKYDYLLGNDVVMAKEGDYGLCNAIIMSKPKSKFLEIWLSEYEKYFNSYGWNEASVILPKILSNRYKNLITVIDEECFFKPSFNEINDIFINNYEINDKLITLHLWESKSIDFLKQIDDNWISNNSHTLYAKIASNLINSNS